MKSALVRRFPEGDKAHSPMASDFRSGALGEESVRTILVYLGDYIVYLYLVNLLTKVVSSE